MFGLNHLVRALLHPHPIREATLSLIRRLGLGRYDQRVKIGAVKRPAYAQCMYYAGIMAQRLGYKKLSVLEFGVAGGNGLASLEEHAQELSRILSVEFEIYGFDTGEGLPKPADYRDLPYHWKDGFYNMDVPALKSRLKSAKLVLGNVEQTVPRFLDDYKPAPIGAVMFDLDFYSSTASALRIFDCPDHFTLPRAFCYFDDVIGSELELYNDYTGARLAIHDFNAAHASKKLTTPYFIFARICPEPWSRRLSIYHNFKHERYCDFVSKENQQCALH